MCWCLSELEQIYRANGAIAEGGTSDKKASVSVGYQLLD